MELHVPKIYGTWCAICGEYFLYPKRDETDTGKVLSIEEYTEVCKNCWDDYSGYRGEKESIYFNESIYLKSISSLLISTSIMYTKAH